MINNVEKLINKHAISQPLANKIVEESHRIITHQWNEPLPCVTGSIHRLVKSILGGKDLYENEKVEANNLLLNQYHTWKTKVNKSANPLFFAAKLAVVGNIIDYGANSLKTDIGKHIDSLLEQDVVIDDRSLLFRKIKEAKSVLYLGDNAGEIVFDKLFIETLNHTNVTYVVRGDTILNDVTLNDAKFVKMHKFAKVIANGDDSPSTILEKCSTDFMKLYNEADIIISKGQGNFEGLYQTKNSKIFFMLLSKCKVMSEILGTSINDIVITQNKF